MKARKGIILVAVIFCLLLSILPRLFLFDAILPLVDTDSETALPYLEDFDCYYHQRMTRDIALYGHPGDTVKDGRPWDSLRYAPEGRDTSAYKPLLAYLAIAANRLISLFSPQSLEQTIYLLDVFLSALAVIPVFLLTFEMCGMTGAVTASVLSVLNLSYLYNTVPGFYDTDCVIIWVSCFFLWFGVKLVKGWQKRDRKSLILSGIGFAVSSFALYHSWYVYFVFPGLFAGALILFSILTWRKENQKSLLSHAPLLLAAWIILVTLLLEKGIISTAMDIAGQIFFKKESSGGLFPSFLSSVNELQALPIWAGSLADLFLLKAYPEAGNSMISLSGGIIPFLSAFVMSVILIIRIIRRDVRIEYTLLLLWYVITLVLSFRGQRFIMLFAVPAAILTGNLVGTVSGWMNQRKLRNRTVYKCALSLLLVFPTVFGVYDLYRSIRSLTPEDVISSDRAVEECLLKIRENTPEDTILATWWDYGYFLQDKGRRGTLFDGGTQDMQRTYFVSRALATENEELSANIFRMLSGSGDEGCDLMLSIFGETEETLSLMDELLGGNKAEAREKLLKTEISEDLADRIAGLLFPEKTPLTECVITPDMPEFCGWFPVFGRSEREKDESTVIFSWRVYRMPISLPESGSSAIDTGYGYEVILEKGDSGWAAHTSLTDESLGEQPPEISRVIVVDDSGCREFIQTPVPPEERQDPDDGDETISWTVIITRGEQETDLSLATSDLVDSVFGRMTFLGGAGLTRYQSEPELSNEVLVYRIIE